MQLTIGKKLGLALGTVILLSAIGAALTYVTVHDLVSVATPTRENCADLTQEIKRSVDAVSGYLVAGGNSFRNDRENAWERIDSASGRLDSLISTSRENADRTILNQLKTDLIDLKSVQDNIEDTALEDGAAHSQLMRDSITAIINEESNLEATIERKQLLKHLADLRGTLNGALADIRAFLIAGDETSWQEFEQNWKMNEAAFSQVSTRSELLTPTQMQEFDRFGRNREAFAPIPGKLDAMRDKADQIAVHLGKLTESSADRQAKLGSTVINVLLLSVILSLAVCVVVYFILRSIPPRISSLVRRAEYVSHGKLDLEPLAVKSSDEFSRLAAAFNTMTENLREMISKTTSQEELLAAQSQTEAILNATADGIITIDEQGSIQTFNPTAAKMFGYGAEEVVGQNVSMLAAPPHREHHDQYLQNYLQTGAAKIIGKERELEGQRKDRSIFPMALRVTELHLGEERIFIGTVQDITSRVEANNAIASAVNQLATSVSQILATTSQQATGARQQTQSVSGTVATVAELARSADEAAERANDVATGAKKMDAVGQMGRQLVEHSVQSMIEAREQVESVAEKVTMLAAKARSISEIITAIDEIAEQTNILALNAAVEASRAGEHGKGFAVVASEVKSLAQQSKKATENVRSLLGEIVAAMQTAVFSTEQSTSLVNQASQVVIESGEAMNQLTRTIRDSALAAQQISIGAKQQASGIAQLKNAATDIQRFAQEMTLGISQIETAARDLNHLSATLSQLAG